MFAEFDDSTFPMIKVKLNNKPESETDFNLFLNQWLYYYDQQQDFKFLFDTRDVSTPHLKYCIRMALFIKELKKKDTQYLQESIILINNHRIKYLLDFIFAIQSPVAPVFIYHLRNDNLTCEEIKSHPDTIIINPGKSLFSFL
tara:strand:+ start:1074 stop:1502 length:429 start_codon:yes stop_codon:yes gene_type:complete